MMGGEDKACFSKGASNLKQILIEHAAYLAICNGGMSAQVKL